MGGWWGLGGGEGGRRVEEGWAVGQWVEEGWGGCICAGDLAYRGRLQIGVTGLPNRKRKLHLKYHRWLTVWLMHHQERERTLTNVNLPLQPAECWRDGSHDALLGKTRTNWRKRKKSTLSEDGHVFTSSPGWVQQKFTAHTIPQQPCSPTLQTLIYSKLQPWWRNNIP